MGVYLGLSAQPTREAVTRRAPEALESTVVNRVPRGVDRTRLTWLSTELSELAHADTWYAGARDNATDPDAPIPAYLVSGI
jgi:hypothetical protein